jgi:hypothetical protein
MVQVRRDPCFVNLGSGGRLEPLTPHQLKPATGGKGALGQLIDLCD